jgi:hypothetical protein
VVIVHETDQVLELKKLIERNKYNAAYGTEAETLEKIRIWETGVLLIHKSESRGVDTRF